MNQPVNLDFSAYIAERTRDFTGREWLFATIDRWLTDPNAPQIFLIAGEPGIGKTAISARLTQFSASDAIPPTDYVCVGDGFLSAVHFCSARNGGWISPDGFARSLSAQLAVRYPACADVLASDPRIRIEQKAGVVSGTMIGVQITNYYAETSEALFNDLVRTPLKVLCSGDGLPSPLTILVDGLDESLNYSGRTNIVRLLASCSDLPPQVRLLLTSRPVDGVLEPFRPLQPFILYARNAENQEDIRAYVSYRFEASAALRNQAGEQARVKQATTGLVSRSKGNFLVVARVLDGLERGELNLANPEALPTDLQDLYAWFLDRLIQGDMRTWRALYRPVLGVLAVAQEPVDALALSWWTSLTRQQVTDALHDLRELLDPALDGCYRLYHESVVDFLTKDKSGPYYLDAAEYHRKIATSYIERFVENRGVWSACDLYGLRHLPTHLHKAEQVAALQGLLFDFDWLQAKLEATDVTAMLADFELVPGDQDLHLMQGALKLSAHVLAQDKAQLAGQLLGRLMTPGSPEVQAVLEQAKQWKGIVWLRPLMPSLMPPGGPLLRTLMGHAESVNAVAVTPDSQRAVSAAGSWSNSSDNSLKVWDLESGMELFMLRGHTGSTRGVVVTPDGRYAISASLDSTLKVWDLEAGTELRTLRGHSSRVNAVTVTPDGRHIISASHDNTLKVWDLASGAELHTLRGHTGEVTAVAMTPDGSGVLSASYDETIRLWDLWSGEELRTLHGHASGITGIVVTPDGRSIISSSWDTTLKIWALKTGAEILTLRGHAKRVTAVAVVPDGRYALSASEDKTLKVWDLKSGQELRTLRGHTDSVRGVAVTPDSKRAVSASYDHTLKVWDLEGEIELSKPQGHIYQVTAVTITPDRQRALSASEDKTLKLWDLKSGRELALLVGHTSKVNAVTVTPDGRRAISASLDCTLKVWDLESGVELLTLRGHTREVTAVAATLDSQYAISASYDKTLKLWDLKSGEILASFSGEGRFLTCDIALDGTTVIAGDEFGRVHILHLEVP
jgi:WD40 repeat protein